MKNILFFTLVFGMVLNAGTIYVNQKSKAKDADGQSWDKAYKNLNQALKIAKNGDDIWVAKGEYIVKSTRLNGINIYGGFSATEVQLSQRKIVNNETKIYGRLALQNALISSVTILEEPERHRVIELKFSKEDSSFKPNKKRMKEARAKRIRQEQRYKREHPEQDYTTEPISNQYAEEVKYRKPPKRQNNDRRDPPRLRKLMHNFDTNLDGKISKREAPEPMKRNWYRLDKNNDGYLDKGEILPPRNEHNKQRPPRRIIYN